MLDQRNGALDVLNVFDLEADLRSRFRPTRLKRCAVRPDSDDLRSPIGKDGVNRASETGAIGQQQHHGGDAPRHSQHGKGCATTVVFHGAVGLSEEIANHNYSFRSASTG